MASTALPLQSGPGQRTALHHLRHNIRLIASAILLSAGAFTFGYDASVIGGVLNMPVFIQQFGGVKTPIGYILPAKTVSVLVATPTVGSLLGALINSTCGDRFGRKKTIYLGCVISVVAAIIQTASTDVAMITVGRTLTGISVFVLVGMAITFQNEIAPPAVKGFLGALSVVCIQTGAVLASGINWATHKSTTALSWRLPIGLQMFFPIIIALCVSFVRDSPTAFLIRGEDERAEESLRSVRQGYSDAEIASEMADLKAQKSLRASEEKVPWTELFKGTNLRRTILATYAGMFVSVSGLIFATQYATIFLQEIDGADTYALVFGLNILTFAGAIAGCILVDLVGRRNLALTSYAAILVIDCIIGGLGFASPLQGGVPKAIAAFSLIFGFVVSAGFGPLTYINTAELPTSRLRNRTNAFALLCNSLTSLTVTYVFPYISNADKGNLGAKTYLIFAGFMVICWIYTFFCFPELNKRSAAEIDVMFTAKLPARQFRGFRVPALANDKSDDLEGDKGNFSVHLEAIKEL